MSTVYGVQLYMPDKTLKDLNREAAATEDSEWNALQEMLEGSKASVRSGGFLFTFNDMSEPDKDDLTSLLDELFDEKSFFAIIVSSDGDREYLGSAWDAKLSPKDIEVTICLIKKPELLADNPFFQLCEHCKNFYSEDQIRQLLEEAQLELNGERPRF